MQLRDRRPDLGGIEGLSARFSRDFTLEMFRRANFSHHFELEVKKAAEAGRIKIPIYLCLGTEFNSAALSMVLPNINIFGQHRCHGLYLSFGGDPAALRDELLGLPSGCAGGMSGSNAIHCPAIKMFGHSGLMGEQVPIAVGTALGSGEPCLTICGDASVEEDYIYPSLGMAASRKLPVLFVCEDNDLSILTPVSVRRNWSPTAVAEALGIQAIEIGDDPWLVAHHAAQMAENLPGFITIHSVRAIWHAGTGNDGEPEWNRYQMAAAELVALGLEKEAAGIDKDNRSRAEKLWSTK